MEEKDFFARFASKSSTIIITKELLACRKRQIQLKGLSGVPLCENKVKTCILLSAAGRKTQLFILLFSEPGPRGKILL